MLRNKILEKLKQDTKTMSDLQKFDYLYKNYIDFKNMIDQIDYYYNLDIRNNLLYVELLYDSIRDYTCEHNKVHYTDNIEKYFYDIPPIIRVRTCGGCAGNDGNHRINTLEIHNINKIPIILVSVSSY